MSKLPFDDLYHLLNVQREYWDRWKETGDRRHLDSFFEATKQIIRTCLVAGHYDGALSQTSRCLETMIDIGAVELRLSLADSQHWNIKYERCMALDIAFRARAAHEMDLFRKATALFCGVALSTVEAHAALRAFQDCAAAARNSPYCKQLYCQALHECGDVCRELGVRSPPGDADRHFKQAFHYYEECLAACGDEFRDSIVADTIVARGRTLIETDPVGHDAAIRQLFNDAYDLYKTAQDRAEKVRIIQNYLNLLEERKKQRPPPNRPA